MTRWVVDDGPFGLLALRLDDTWAWPSSTLHLVEEVASASTKDKSGRRQKLLAMRDPGGKEVIEVHKILVGSAAADFLFKHLRPSSVGATRDLGEDASIALCAKHLEPSVFVTMDKGAAYQALAELGLGRVATPFDCWDDLHTKGLIDKKCCEALFEATAKGGALAGRPKRFP